MTRNRNRALAAGLICAALLAVGWMAFPARGPSGPTTDPTRLLIDAVDWVRAAGPWGDVLFVLLYGVQTVLLVPASWSHAAAGFVYGPVVGLLVASACATGFSGVNFWLGRTLFRGMVERRVAKSARLAALDGLVAERGAWFVFLVRLPPVSPFNPVSYAFGATRVRFRDFLLGTWAGSLLPVTVFSQLGAGLSDLASFFAGEQTGPSWMRWGGLVVTLVVTALVSRYAKQALDRASATLPPAPVRAAP